MLTHRARIKKTYNLSSDVVDLVRSMVGSVAATQDAVVERSIQEMARQRRDLEHTAQWARAAEDAEYQDEAAELGGQFAVSDRVGWETAR